MLSGQCHEIPTRKLMSDFDFNPENGLRTDDLVKGTSFMSIRESLKFRVWDI